MYRNYIKIIIFCIIIIFIVLCFSSDTQINAINNESITAEEFFGELLSQLNIDTNKIAKDYRYCSPSISYLVYKGYISSYQGYLVEQGYYDADFLIDKGLVLVGYFDRPMDAGNYNSITERVAIEVGLIKNPYETLSYDDGMKIIYKLSHNKFTRITYSNVNTKIKYTIDNFYDMSKSLSKTLHYIDMLPDNCISEFNRRGFRLRIVKSASAVHPKKHSNVTAFINFSTKEMYVMKGYESDIFHEFGHLMFDKIQNKTAVCKYLHKIEHTNAITFTGIRDLDDPEEYCADVFCSLMINKNNEEHITSFKNECPITHYFMNDVLMKNQSSKFFVKLPIVINKTLNKKRS